MSIEAMKQALEALEIWEQMYPMSSASAYRLPAITSLRQAIAKAEKQEPVAWWFQFPDKRIRPKFDTIQHGGDWKPLYDYPQPKQEPVAVVQDLDEVKRKHLVYECGFDWKDPLYTHQQPKREPLTVDQIAELLYKFESASAWYQFARAIEAAHGVK